MTHRFIRQFNLNIGSFEINDSEFVNQIHRVLKLRPGERVILGDGQGQEAVAEILSFKKDGVEVAVKKIQVNQNEPLRPVALYLAILKKENFDWAVQKAVEAGVAKIVPVIARHTVKLNLNLKRLEKIIKEAAEQAGRGRLPVIMSPISFSKAIGQAKANDLNLFFEKDGAPLPKIKPEIKSIGIFIGPEGGWDEAEIQMARRAGLQLVTLGQLTLRAETAAIVATYLAAQ